MISAAKRLKVLQVGKFYPPFMGGIETHLQNLCGELQHSVDLDVLVANDDRKTLCEVIDGVRVCRAGRLATFASSPICMGLIGRIRASRADIVHVHLPNPVALLAYLLSGHRGRLVLTYHSDTVRQATLSRLFQPILNLALRRADRIIATSANYMRSSKVLTEYRDRCEVIPYGIPLDQFQVQDEAKIAQLRNQYGTRLILGVGRLVYYKGFEHLVKAMANVNGTLLLIGDGPLREKLENLARTCGVADRTFFLGGIDNRFLTPYYQAADIFALPSVARSEAFGIVQIEAMAAGKPVVNTALDSGVPGVSLGGITGLTVPPEDSAALAAALTKLLDDSALRSQMGEAGRVRAHTEFSVSQMGARTIGLYETLVGATARGAAFEAPVDSRYAAGA